MAKEFFKNLPDTSTPLTAERLNGLLDGEESMGSIIVEDIECKNLLNITVSTTTINGVTFTVNEDKSITLNGTSNATTSLRISNEKITKPMNYIFGITTDFSSIEHNFEVGGYVYDSNGTYKGTLSTSNPTILLNNGEYVTNWFIYFTSGATFNDFTIYPQLEKGNVATDYVEHKEFSNKQIYSTNEIKIGTWIDGKSIYRKVVANNETFSNNTTKTINISNLDKIINIGFSAKLISSSNQIVTQPYYDSSTNKLILMYFDENSTTLSNVIRVWTGTDQSWYITIWFDYTKTTD